MTSPERWQGIIHRYRAHLPVTERTPIVTLNEGNTPLISAPNFVKSIAGDFELHLKYEAANLTCSFKDRGMTVAVSKARERGAEIVICASTGNTSASAAAYAARAKMKCVVILPHGKIAMGKLAQALMHGAITVAIEGNFDEALRIVRELGETGKVEVVNSINPVRIDGLSFFAGRQRREHHRVLEGLQRIQSRRSNKCIAEDVRRPGCRGRADC